MWDHIPHNMFYTLLQDKLTQITSHVVSMCVKKSYFTHNSHHRILMVSITCISTHRLSFRWPRSAYPKVISKSWPTKQDEIRMSPVREDTSSNIESQRVLWPTTYSGSRGNCCVKQLNRLFAETKSWCSKSDNAFISFLLKSNLPQTLIESFSFRVLTDMFTKVRKTLKTVFSNVDRFHSHIFTPFHWGDPCRLVAGQVLTSGLLVWCVWDQNKVNHGFLDGLPWFTKQSGRHVFVKILSKIGRVLSNSIFEDRSSKLMFIQTFPILMGME